MRCFRIAGGVLGGLVWIAAGLAQQSAEPAPAALPVPPEQVVSHTSRTVDWYRRIVALQQLPVDPDDVVLRDRLYQTALTTVQLAFEFGRAAAILASAKSGTGTTGSSSPQSSAAGSGQPANDTDAAGPSASLDRAGARLAARVAALQGQLSTLDEQIAHAGRKERDGLTAQRGEVAAALELTREIQNTVGQIERFEESSDTYAGAGSSGLAAQIIDLERSVPEARRAPAGLGLGGAASPATGSQPGGAGPAGSSGRGPSPGAAAAAPAAAAKSPVPSNFRPESAGVISLTGEWFSLASTRRQVAGASKQSDGLLKELESVRTTVTQDARTIARQGLASTSTDPQQITQARQQLQSAATRFRQLSTLLIPLGEQAISLESARNILSEWHDSLQSRSAAVARYLLLRVGVLLGSVLIVLVISDLWRRAPFRYLHDSRRRQQFLAIRRVVVSVALALVIAFGLVSEVGSVATYAGLITAGLAVALQNVILAVVAYFFLIGRYGVRVGDRITLAGVTGRVVDIGLIRIYLMELIGPELRSSGRMVVLSNAVLFQPTALFKQMPGGDYFSHTILLTFSPATDIQEAQTRLAEAADSVYENYRPAIEQQHAALQRFIDFETAMPRPEVYLQFSDKGLECTVRYPVEPARAASIDQKMLVAVRAAQAKPPELELVAGPLLHTG
jgi:small-conductance mechanosensitive channel